MCMNHEEQQKYQLMYHEECAAYQHFMYMEYEEGSSRSVNSCTTAYQHVCHFMYMNHEEQQKYQLMYHEECAAYPHFMYMEYEERSSRSVNSCTTAYQHVCHFMYMNHEERSGRSINSCTMKSAQGINMFVTSCR